MANALVATISFKVDPIQYTALHVLANRENKTISEFVRDTVADALSLDAQVEHLLDPTPRRLVDPAVEYETEE